MSNVTYRPGFKTRLLLLWSLLQYLLTERHPWLLRALTWLCISYFSGSHLAHVFALSPRGVWSGIVIVVLLWAIQIRYEQLETEANNLDRQIRRLSSFILTEMPHEIGSEGTEGAIDTAIRLLDRQNKK